MGRWFFATPPKPPPPPAFLSNDPSSSSAQQIPPAQPSVGDMVSAVSDNDLKEYLFLCLEFYLPISLLPYRKFPGSSLSSTSCEFTEAELPPNFVSPCVSDLYTQLRGGECDLFLLGKEVDEPPNHAGCDFLFLRVAFLSYGSELNL